MAKKIDYASLYTLRKDGRYMGYWHDAKGSRHAIYDRDPERLHRRIEEKEEEKAATFREVAEAWERCHREEVTPRTWSNYKPHYEDILATHGDEPCEAMTAAAIYADLQRAKAAGYSATIVNTRRVIYNSILDYAVAQGIIPYNPALSVRLPKGLPRSKRRAPTDEEIKIICSSLDAPFGFFPFFLLCTGLRKSEALALLKSDIDLKAGEISVTKSLTYIDGAHPRVKPPKSESGIRTVPIPEILKDPLRRAMQTDSVLLFPATPSNRNPKASGYMSERGYEGAWDRYCAAVGLVDEDGNHTLTAHNLRHGTATLLYESGVDVYTAQQILGHANIETTMKIYVDLRAKQRTRSVKRFDNGLKKLMPKKRA